MNYVVDSFRHEDEVAVFRKSSDFHLLAVTASAEVRFQRIKSRGRESDPKTLEDFNRIEQAESTSLQAEGQNLTATEAVADQTLENNGTLEQFHARLAELVPKLMAKMLRPGWDEYFMKMAQVAALRSNCVKRKVAAVIVREKRVISTGYNGTPSRHEELLRRRLPAMQQPHAERHEARRMSSARTARRTRSPRRPITASRSRARRSTPRSRPA
jgi:dCMP deaminase